MDTGRRGHHCAKIVVLNALCLYTVIDLHQILWQAGKHYNGLSTRKHAERARIQ